MKEVIFVCESGNIVEKVITAFVGKTGEGFQSDIMSLRWQKGCDLVQNSEIGFSCE